MGSSSPAGSSAGFFARPRVALVDFMMTAGSCSNSSSSSCISSSISSDRVFRLVAVVEVEAATFRVVLAFVAAGTVLMPLSLTIRWLWPPLWPLSFASEEIVAPLLVCLLNRSLCLVKEVGILEKEKGGR